MGFYITTFLLGGLVAGNTSTATAAPPKADKAPVNADNTFGDESPTSVDERTQRADIATAALITLPTS